MSYGSEKSKRKGCARKSVLISTRMETGAGWKILAHDVVLFLLPIVFLEAWVVTSGIVLPIRVDKFYPKCPPPEREGFTHPHKHGD